jgi:small-conductance mechanosensitive channel
MTAMTVDPRRGPAMRRRSWLYAGWALLAVVLLALTAVRSAPGLEVEPVFDIGLAAFPVTAAIILARRPGNGVGWTLAVISMAAVVTRAGEWGALTFPDWAASAYLDAVSRAADTALWGAAIALLHLFPTGAPIGIRHRRVFAGLVTYFAVTALMDIIVPLELGGPGLAAVVLLVLLFAALGVGALWVRRRRADAVERAQLNWFVAGSVLFVVFIIVPWAVSPEGQTDSFGSVFGVGETLVRVLIVIGMWALPAAITVAILRYRLYEIDRLVSRTVSYAVVIGMLVAVYAGGVFLLRSLLPVEGDLAVAASTLAVAALFNPLRRRVQQRVDRRFNRPRYDAEREVERFAGRMRTDLDLDDVTGDLLGVVTMTVQPAAATVWIRGDRR